MTPNSRFPRLAAPLVCMALLAGACGDGEQADATGRGVVDLATTTSEMPAETSSVAPPSSTTDAPQNTTAAPPSSSTTVASVPVDPGPVVIPVLFGDVELLEVVPDPDGGPGRLGERGEQDVYTLDVGDDQAILIEQLGICDFDGDDSLVIDVDGAGLNHSVVILEDGCRSASRFTSNATGTVTLTVRDSADEVIGDYSFRVVDVTDPEPIRLLAGDEVGPNSPVPGAGWVEHRGQRDIYLYDVADDESFLIEQIGGCDYDGGDFLAADVDGAGINSTAIFSEERCSLADRFTAKASGTVTIVVEDAGNDTFGTYAFRLTDVTDPAPIELVDGSEIMPAMEDGSGNLEARGMRDVYTYNATAGQAFVIEQLGVCDFEGSDNLVIDIDGAGINSSMSLREDRCDRVERFEPDEDGIVEIVVLSRGQRQPGVRRRRRRDQQQHDSARRPLRSGRTLRARRGRHSRDRRAQSRQRCVGNVFIRTEGGVMKGMTRMIATLLAFALLTAACGGSDGTGDTTATTAAPTTSIAASSQDTSPSTSAVTATTAPPDTTEPVATTPPAGAASIDCGIWEFVQQFETPAEMGDAIFQGDIDAEAIAPSTIAECLGFNSWRSELVIDGIDGDGTDFTKLTVLSELTISGDTVTSRERFIPDDSTTRIFEARAFGDQIWLSGPDGDWFLMPAEGEGGGFGDMAEHAETFGFFFSAGLLTAFAVVGSLVYGPLAEPGERVDVGGVDATIWSVTPEAASAFAQSLGANLPPAAFADTEATYWVTDNGQIVRIEISIPPGSPIPEAQEGSLTYRLYDFGAPISVDPIDG